MRSPAVGFDHETGRGNEVDVPSQTNRGDPPDEGQATAAAEFH